MDKQTRNLIQKATQDARRLLESEFGQQLEGTFDILPNGHISPLPGKHLSDDQKIIRKKIVAAITHEKAGGVSDDEAVVNYLREASFTALNRFAALKMLEARDLVQECVSKGEQSSGFKEFCGLAPGLAVLSDKGYRLYIESLFDELGTEIHVLFDRMDMASLLWPGKKTMDALFEIFNREEIAGIWAEDETIGWVYQYFNSSEERKKMRDESAAPRNSRELAVRNQFFTPRYVVAFLTDNTLGRIWYEMRQGNTRLKDQCQYLVRRPVEIFLKIGATAPETSNKEDLSQEEILKQPVFISHRQLKDPRDIKMLDPACGSLHFGLYAFDLYEIIYDEAWDLECSLGKDAFVRSPGLKPLTEIYADKDAFLLDMPKLIIEHNIHGIDIDPRAVQIGTLALWMRAQKSWLRLGVKAADRPRIKRSNIVTAEPMPGEEEMLREFTAGLFPRVLGQLVEVIFDKMKLAGEAGSLLKIEEEIRDGVSKARQQWLKAPKPEQRFLFPDKTRKPKQQELRFDLSGVTDETFWEHAEDRILDALKAYAEQAENGRTVHRRLFAEDAFRGFAFIDLCRKRYDVVLMNPPFGESSFMILSYLEREYPNWTKNLLCASISRAVGLLWPLGCLGVIFDRTAAIKSSYERFRTDILDARILSIADTGWNVLDANVETTVHVLKAREVEGYASFFDVREYDPDIKANKIKEYIFKSNAGYIGEDIFVVKPKTFLRLPNAIVGYYFDEFLLNLFERWNNLSEASLQARQGHALVSDEHFRLFFEISNSAEIGKNKEFTFMYNGAEFSLFATPSRDLTKYGVDGHLVASNKSVVLRNPNYQFLSGVGYGKRGEIIDAHVLPSLSLFTSEGQAITGIQKDEAKIALSYLNSSLAQYTINQYCGQHKHCGYINLLPIPSLHKSIKKDVIENAEKLIEIKRQYFALDETTLEFGSVLLGIYNWVTSHNLQKIFELLANRLKSDTLDLRERITNNDNYFKQAARLSSNETEQLDRYILKRPLDFPWSDMEKDRGSESENIFFNQVLISQIIGLTFGRWDARIALDISLAPKLSDPFDPLPVCPPGMLVGPDGLPAQPGHIVTEEWLRARPDANTLPPEGLVKNPTIPDADYQLRISWDGILVDDPGFNGGQPHGEDIIRRVRETLDLIWKDKAADIEQEACDILNIPDLRTYFRKSFFADHIKRYSKSRRKAPIYWQLSTSSASYSVWLYYHRFTKDIFYKVLNDFIIPKLQFEERELTNARQQYGPSPTANQRKEISARESFVAELKTFKEEVAQVAPLWNPNLNDGVIINFAPLWRLVPQNRSWQKECKAVWDKLISGEYDWAHLAMHLWPERVVPKCAKDRSLAIAHGLDEIFWEKDDKGKSQPKKVSKETVAALITERTSPTIKSALDGLLKASDSVDTAGKKRKKKT